MNIQSKIEELGGYKCDADWGDVRRVMESDVQRVELHIEQKLPGDYRDFLLSYGSGMGNFEKPVVFSLPHWVDGFDHIDHFFGAVPRESHTQYDLSSNFDYWVVGRERAVPKNLLPIAGDGGGNLICLSISGADAGSVLFWDHEEAIDLGDEPGYENVYRLAPSFDAFIELLQVYEEDET